MMLNNKSQSSSKFNLSTWRDLFYELCVRYSVILHLSIELIKNETDFHRARCVTVPSKGLNYILLSDVSFLAIVEDLERLLNIEKWVFEKSLSQLFSLLFANQLFFPKSSIKLLCLSWKYFVISVVKLDVPWDSLSKICKCFFLLWYHCITEFWVFHFPVFLLVILLKK